MNNLPGKLTGPVQMILHASSLIGWMVISFTVGDLFGSIFLNTAIMGIADSVANSLLIVMLRHLPRVVLLSFTYGGLGLSLVISSVLRGFLYDKTRMIDVALMVTAKFFASSKR